MSHAFRDLLKKVGSGVHTAKDLTRAEAAAATRMMLLQEATPAQIGAFMIAHRIKRPRPQELAGMLDAYDQLGPKLGPIQSPYPVTVLCSPYDGRSRTTPISPLTALILAAANAPVILHGGDRMPTKYGVPFIDIWQGLDLPLQHMPLPQAQQLFERTGLGFIYTPQHFPEAEAMTPYRDQIGKRPPFATIELMWSPYAGDAHLVTGYVHPPTEEMARATYAIRGTHCYTAVKGLEGSCDLPRARTAILALGNPDEPDFERLLLHPRDYGFAGEDAPLEDTPHLVNAMQQVLSGQPGELMQSTIWNGGFYLWRCGVCQTFEAGLALAERMLIGQTVTEKLEEVKAEIADLTLVPLP
ncbi:MAG: anthranilate phosphoribosyltransferase family protein [Leptolyngbyaceae cyanobacterium MO_188.B28]|nr:anthranilate phosphoribosyltransferase family protein [Leptolyngbyaceae cyanobacterium MO_188.B28]